MAKTTKTRKQEAEPTMAYFVNVPFIIRGSLTLPVVARAGHPKPEIERLAAADLEGGIGFDLLYEALMNIDDNDGNYEIGVEAITPRIGGIDIMDFELIEPKETHCLSCGYEFEEDES